MRWTLLVSLAVAAGCKSDLKLTFEASATGSNAAVVQAIVEKARPEIETCYRGEDVKSASLLTVHLDATGTPKLWFKPAFEVPKCVTGVLTKLVYPPATEADRVVTVKIINATQRQRNDGYGSDLSQ
jgi:hypothetical protein